MPAASIVHTTSSSGLCGNFGQANYGAAKMGIVGLSRVLAIEGSRYGIRSNAISPSARTRMTAHLAGADELLGTPPAGGPDPFAPEHVSAVVAWLAEADCPANGQVYHVAGRRIRVLEVTRIAHEIDAERDWTPDALDAALRTRWVDPLTARALIT